MSPASRNSFLWKFQLWLRYLRFRSRRTSRMISRIADAIKRKAIPIAMMIPASAAIWYCFKISNFKSLPEERAKSWLVSSEILLIVASVLLFLGLFGEWPDTEEWKKRPWYKAAKAAVILGVLGEILGDAGIFESEGRLQELQTATNIELDRELIALGPREHLLQDVKGLNPTFIGSLKPFAGQKISTRFCSSPPPKSENDAPYFIDDEAVGFAMLLSSALHDAGWDSPHAEKLECHGSGGRGVFIYVDGPSENTQKAAEALGASIIALPTPASVSASKNGLATPESSDSIVLLVLSHPM